MHDPKTVAFEIRSPIKRATKWNPEGYRRPLVTIWHLDPERGGDDDSCGWFAPENSDADREWARTYAKAEWPFWFANEYATINLAFADDLAVLAQAWRECREHVHKGTKWGTLKAWEVSQIFLLLSSPGDNFGHLIRAARDPENATNGGEGLTRLLILTLKSYRRVARPWYKHPKFHVHHWRFQFHDVQAFNRLAFSRCAECGRRFPWGYAPVSTGSGGGPKFLCGEKNVYHHECMPSSKPVFTRSGPGVKVEQVK